MELAHHALAHGNQSARRLRSALRRWWQLRRAAGAIAPREWSSRFENERDYYLERRYPSFGNLVPRDIASRAAKAECDSGHGVGESGLGVYLDNVREIERRIQHSEARGAAEIATPDAPIGTPDSFEEHASLMFDLAAAAFQADVTRVFTFMMSRELSQRTYPQIGVGEQHHSVSHHQNNPQKMAQMVKINTYYMQLYARFLEKLRSAPDGDGSVFDHSLLVYGAGMADSNGHATDPLPVILTGGGVGRGSRHVQLPVRTPIGNLWMNIAGKFGAPVPSFGDSTGTANVVS